MPRKRGKPKAFRRPFVLGAKHHFRKLGSFSGKMMQKPSKEALVYQCIFG